MFVSHSKSMEQSQIIFLIGKLLITNLDVTISLSSGRMTRCLDKTNHFDVEHMPPKFNCKVVWNPYSTPGIISAVALLVGIMASMIPAWTTAWWVLDWLAAGGQPSIC